jgi:2-(1,2-epoxy-1,2-dihydrophenyl)acetyl-CoA isomerase
LYKVFPDATLQEEGMKLAVTLSEMPTVGIGLTKRLLNEGTINDLHMQLKREGEEQVTAASSNDYKEGVKAFLEKRRAVFKGD